MSSWNFVLGWAEHENSFITSGPDVVSCNNEGKKGGKDQESIQSSTTPDQAYHMGMWQKHT